MVEILQADVSKSNFRAFLLTVHCLFSLQSSSVYGRQEQIRMYALSKLNKQHEQTWVNFQKRLSEVQFSYGKLFPNPDVYRFIKNKAVSVGSCEGYFVPSLLTTTTYLLACDHARVQTLTHDQPLNIYTIFVGYPGTGMFNGLTIITVNHNCYLQDSLILVFINYNVLFHIIPQANHRQFSMLLKIISKY